MKPRRILGLTILVAAVLSACLMGISSPAYAQSPPMAHWVDPLPVPPVDRRPGAADAARDLPPRRPSSDASLRDH